MTQFKKCKTCFIEKPLDSFIKDRTSKFGRLGHCKQCTSTKKEKEVLEDGYKRCSKCKEVKILKLFRKNIQSKDGLYSQCTQCARIDYFKRNKKDFREPRSRPAPEEGKKYCPKCDENILFSNFNKDASTKSGLESCCKDCKNSYIDSVIKLSGVYKITNPVNQVYIGSSKNIKNRWSSYKKSHQNKISNSFELYGYENHVFEIIEECLEENLKCRERYWQDHYDVLGKMGLNDVLEKCGSLKQVFSEEFKNRIRITNTGKKQSEETKRKRVESSTTTRLVVDLSTGIFYYSIKEASVAFNMSANKLYYQLVYAKINNTNLIIC